MKVFISWSGGTSGEVANALHGWLPSVIQSLKPYVSTEDIAKGSRWLDSISRELQDSAYGIVCLTRENLSAPWLNFEAGALSKEMERGRVSPFLLGLEPEDVRGPLGQFQATRSTKTDVRQLVDDLNEACGDSALEAGRLEEAFALWWPGLEEQLQPLLELEKRQEESAEMQGTSDDGGVDVIEEMRSLVRLQRGTLMSASLESRGLSPSHPVFEDLNDAWQELNRALFFAEDSVKDGGLGPAVEGMRRPVEFLLRRVERRRRPGWARD